MKTMLKMGRRVETAALATLGVAAAAAVMASPAFAGKVTAASPFVESQIMAVKGNRNQPVLLKGVEIDREERISHIGRSLVSGDLVLFRKTPDALLVGPDEESEQWITAAAQQHRSVRLTLQPERHAVPHRAFLGGRACRQVLGVPGPARDAHSANAGITVRVRL